MSLSTHVLDAGIGQPAGGIRVELRVFGEQNPLQAATTDADGRIKDLGARPAGMYQLVFDTGAYFAARGVATFYPQVVVAFEISDPGAHHHVPLLLSPFAYSTYRGS